MGRVCWRWPTGVTGSTGRRSSGHRELLAGGAPYLTTEPVLTEVANALARPPLRAARDTSGSWRRWRLEAGPDVHRLRAVVSLRREHEVLDVQELARGRAIPPADDLRRLGLARVQALPDEGRNDMRGLRVIAFARAVQVHRQEVDPVEAVRPGAILGARPAPAPSQGGLPGVGSSARLGAHHPHHSPRRTPQGTPPQAALLSRASSVEVVRSCLGWSPVHPVVLAAVTLRLPRLHLPLTTIPTSLIYKYMNTQLEGGARWRPSRSA